MIACFFQQLRCKSDIIHVFDNVIHKNSSNSFKGVSLKTMPMCYSLFSTRIAKWGAGKSVIGEHEPADQGYFMQKAKEMDNRQMQVDFFELLDTLLNRIR